VLEPVILKSEGSSPVTGSLSMSEYERVLAFVTVVPDAGAGEVRANDETEGAVVSAAPIHV
jgi:hypothetical protein